MDPDLRNAVLFGGLLFLVFFAGMTLVVLFEDGFSILIVFAVFVVGLLGIALWGAINSPPDNRR